MLTFTVIAKVVAEIALLSLVGQWLVGLLAGAGRERNLFYQLLRTLGSPFVRFARLVTPRLVLDRHVPLVAFLLLAFVWVFATFYKIQACVQMGVELCK